MKPDLDTAGFSVSLPADALVKSVHTQVVNFILAIIALSRCKTEEGSVMNPDAMRPFGLSLLDYLKGDKSAVLSIIRDDGLVTPLPAAGFFRDPRKFDIESIALGLASGRVLDVGAGTGIHSKYLQDKGLAVCAIDVLPEAVHVMREKGVRDVRQADVMSFEGDRFDTILMMGHGIGVVETIQGLDRFLACANRLLMPGGQILLTSVDVRCSTEPKDLAYQQHNIESGRYFGEIRMRITYKDINGPSCGWLHVDAQTLMEHARHFGWSYQLACRQEDGNYLAKLSFEP
jgi:2-polyprenyl-3-methyl-5-hydroxy-6-metoxy-1,4-benzoquinol methylase